MTHRMVVAGTTFGQVYAEGLGRNPPPGVRLVGIIAAGSERSRACAERLAVPLYTSPADVPDDVDSACVVVRSGLLGGSGSELAQQLLRRNIHVLQEHPLHPDEIAQQIRTARHVDRAWELSTFYPHLPAVRRFRQMASALTAEHPLQALEATCGYQVGYATLELLVRLAGRIRPLHLDASQSYGNLCTLTGRIGGVPTQVRLRHELRPDRPDLTQTLINRITVTTGAGELSLASVVGPVVWTGTPWIPADLHRQTSPFFTDELPASRTAPTAAVLDDPGNLGQGEHLTRDWPAAASNATRSFLRRLSDPVGRATRHDRWLAAAHLWQQVVTQIGPPDDPSRPPGTALEQEQVAALRDSPSRVR